MQFHRAGVVANHFYQRNLQISNSVIHLAKIYFILLKNQYILITVKNSKIILCRLFKHNTMQIIIVNQYQILQINCSVFIYIIIKILKEYNQFMMTIVIMV